MSCFQKQKKITLKTRKNTYQRGQKNKLNSMGKQNNFSDAMCLCTLRFLKFFLMQMHCFASGGLYNPCGVLLFWMDALFWGFKTSKVNNYK